MNINYFMREALKEAKYAFSNNEVPVGGILVDNKSNEIIERSHNKINKEKNAIYHCEIDLIIKSCKKLSRKYLNDTVMFVTLEPCLMCARALVHARVSTLVFACHDPKSGALISCDKAFERPYLNHRIEVRSGILANEASALLKSFFKSRRAK